MEGGRMSRRLSIREHQAWLSSGMPTDPATVDRLLDEIFFTDTDRHEKREHITFQKPIPHTYEHDFHE